MATTFTVLFDGQFWCGILERREAGSIAAVRVVFGPEPTDALLMQYLSVHGVEMLQRLDAAPGMPSREPEERRSNPKRAMREARRAAADRAISTASQAAVKLTQSAQKKAGQALSSEVAAQQRAEKRRKLAEKRKRRHRDS